MENVRVKGKGVGSGVGTGKRTGRSMRTRLSKLPFSKLPFLVWFLPDCGNTNIIHIYIYYLIALLVAMKNGRMSFSLRQFLIASDCGCDAVVHSGQGHSFRPTLNESRFS